MKAVSLHPSVVGYCARVYSALAAIPPRELSAEPRLLAFVNTMTMN